ncbi:MAG: methionine sulfoxide reductase [Epsilonproteobacteria bacterium]|nr:MAG: methionine sulfoxide reductase [Campylobacterota bacterium]
MKTLLIASILGAIWLGISADSQPKTLETLDIPYNKLTAAEERVILHKGTERAYSGKYYLTKDAGVYQCKRCNAPLYNSGDKFDSHCGWPSFDDEIAGAVTRIPDKDGRRTEIVCSNCGAHLGHVFKGEHMTDKNIRHCVNSLSLSFEPEGKLEEKKAYFAGGCFWGVEHYLEELKGVTDVVSGYMGGKTKDPTYYDVSYKKTGHLEVVEVTYNPNIISYEEIARVFFEIHDPTQDDGQGPDIGDQYLSAVFYGNDEEKKTVKKLIGLLKGKGFNVVTQVRPNVPFYKAEKGHQDYYKRTKKQPYCHGYVKRF